MCLLRDVWAHEEADFKSLDALEAEFGLKENEFDVFSSLADYFSDACAHLLTQQPDSIVVGDWIGAFSPGNTRPSFLYQTSPSFYPDSLRSTQELCYPPPATRLVYTIGNSAPSLIRLHSQPPSLTSWNGTFKKVSVSSLQKRQGSKEVLLFFGLADQPKPVDPLL